jgi:hypothetical protein
MSSPTTPARALLAVAGPPAPLTEVPAYRGPLIGRLAELRRLREALRHGARLLTLLGPAGVGKTRLAVELAEYAPGAVAFCDLSTSRDLDQACGALSRALSIPLEGSGKPAAQIGAWLSGRGPLLLLLDNFEQLVETCAEAVGRWHEQCRGVRFLVTSRHPLGLPAELAFPLAPLSLPADREASRAALEASEAVQLFLKRPRPPRGRRSTSSGTAPWSRRWCGGSTGCLWRSSSPPPGSRSSPSGG